MGWATGYIKRLKQGHNVSFRPRGNSMRPKIKSGQLCTVSPDVDELDVDDIVLCRVRGREFLHLIKAIDGTRYQIGNNQGHINGWINIDAVFGKLTKVED